LQIHPLLIGHGVAVFEHWLRVETYGMAELPGFALHDLDDLVSNPKWLSLLKTWSADWRAFGFEESRGVTRPPY